ncbi:DUF6249 domain-containing protein [Phenylobacterium sp.]|jgi:hypothetical protein|uniref:DUF6249 domain-containing protein n=1 Tax=Phenylobacterium sp. TaxID=1871053 RepID=UPI002F94F25E
MTTAFQMLIVLGFPAAIIVLALWFRHRERLRVLQVVEDAAQRQQPLSPELVRALPGVKAPTANVDLRRGVMLIAVGIALVLIGLCALVGVATSGGQGAIAVGVGIGAVGAIPLCIGIALVFLSRADRPLVP